MKKKKNYKFTQSEKYQSAYMLIIVVFYYTTYRHVRQRSLNSYIRPIQRYWRAVLLDYP